MLRDFVQVLLLCIRCSSLFSSSVSFFSSFTPQPSGSPLQGSIPWFPHLAWSGPFPSLRSHCILLFTLPTRLPPLRVSFPFIKSAKPSPTSDFAYALPSAGNILSPRFLISFSSFFRYQLKSHLGEAFLADLIKCSYPPQNNFFWSSLFFSQYHSLNLVYAHVFCFHRQNLIFGHSLLLPLKKMSSIIFV